MCTIQVRFLIGVMIFLGYLLIYVVRYNLSVHIVDMARIQVASKLARMQGRLVGTKLNSIIRTQPGWKLFALFDWTDQTMGRLFAAYHIGYCICFPIFHNFGDRVGPKWVVGISGIVSGLLTYFTPGAANYNYWLLFFVRIVIGFCAGAMQPSMVQILRYWVPPMERNYFMWVHLGASMGSFSTIIACATVQYYTRWQLAFDIAGLVQILWSVLWLLIVNDTPSYHGFISKKELLYLENSIGTIFTLKVTNTHAPWKKILRSMAFWSLCILNFGYSWIIISLCIHGPLYFSRIYGYTIFTASYITALPLILRLVLGTILIHTFHWYKINYPSRIPENIWKYFIIVSHIFSGSIMMLIWITDLNADEAVLTIVITLTAAAMDLTMELCYDLSPNYANSLLTVIKIIGTTPGIIVPFVVGNVTFTYGNSLGVWKNIWCFHGLVLLLSGIVFIIWGELHVQPWNSNLPTLRPKKQKNMPHISPKMSKITEEDEDDTSLPGSIRISKQSKRSNLGRIRFSKANLELKPSKELKLESLDGN